MKRKWHALIDGFTFPLVLMFIGMMMIGIGNTYDSITAGTDISTMNKSLQILFMFFKYGGSLLIEIFPLILLLNVLGKRYNDSIPIIGGFVNYFILSITTMFFGSTSLPSYCYTTVMGLQLDLSSIMGSAHLRMPLNLGLITSLLVLVIIRFVYKWSRRRLNYGLMPFIDNDTWFFIMSSLLTIAIGVAVSYGYTFFISGITAIFNFIAADLNNPAGLFIYGLLERIFEIMGLGNIVHASFWTTSLGGTWTNTLGVVFNGDVSVWTAQFAAGAIEKGVGRLITPYYVMNLFIVPSLALALFFKFTGKPNRGRALGLLIIGIITSLLSSSLMPLEILLLIIAPEFLCFHIIASSTLYGIFAALNVSLGFNYSGALAYATPGTLLELLSYTSTESLRTAIITILIVGVIAFAVYQLAAYVYYNYMAQDFLDHYGALRRRKQIIKGLGGIGNIRLVDSTPTKLKAVLYDPTLVDFEMLQDAGAYLIKEDRFGYDVDIGPGAVMLRRDIRTEQKYFLQIPMAKK